MSSNYLIISNGAMSNIDSNGRTVANLLQKYNKENLAQFCTYGSPDFELCGSFYKISDKDALLSFIKRKKINGLVLDRKEKKIEKETNNNYRKVKKSPLNCIVREFVWKYGCWKNKNLWNWIEKVNPQKILLNLADNKYTIDLAINISKKYNIPIIVFSTEEYVFKNYNYMTKRKSILYTLFYISLNKTYKKLEKYVEKGYFNSPLLKEEYGKKYKYPCYIAMNKSTIKWIDNYRVGKEVKISYIGNLGINRHLPLIEIAETINEIYPGVRLDIYGKIPNDNVKKAFDECKFINYNGFVSYEEVEKILHDSTLLVHAESQEDFYIRDLKYAFSTKIADSICSGTPLFIYGSENMAAMNMMKKYECAFCCTKKEKLKSKLKSALSDVEERKKVLNNAKNIEKKFFRENENIF